MEILNRALLRLLIISVFSYQFFSLSAWSIEYTNVPPSCQMILQAMPLKNNVSPLKQQIDWSGVIENMEKLGYPARIVQAKLRTANWDAEIALQTIRQTLDQPNWQWGTPFSESDSRLIGAELTDYKDETISLYALPYWNSLNGFDVPVAVNAFLKDQGYPRNESKNALNQFAPLWLNGPLGLENARLYHKLFSRDDHPYEATLLTEHLPERHRATMLAYLKEQLIKEHQRIIALDKDRAEPALAMLSSLPWLSLPKVIRAYLEENWINTKKYPPLILENIQHIQRGYKDAGNCQLMTSGHLQSLGIGSSQKCDKTKNDNNDWQQAILIRVQGRLVGSLKLVGDPSMIALRNVFDNNGRLVLVMGAVYHLAKDNFAELSKNKLKNHEWRIVDVENLKVHPSAFMLNENAWSSQNLSLLLTLAKDSMTKEDLLRIIVEIAQSGYANTTELQEELQRVVWSELMKSLNRLRQTLE